MPVIQTTGIQVVAIYVTDLERAKAFYCETVGCSESDAMHAVSCMPEQQRLVGPAACQSLEYSWTLVQELEQRGFFRVIWGSRVTGCGANAPIALPDQLLPGQILVLAITPFTSHLGVEPLRKRLCQTIGKSLDHDRIIVVLIFFEVFRQLIRPMSGGDDERSQVVRHAGRSGCDKISQTMLRFAVTSLFLLP